MEPFTTLSATALPLMRDNIDTDAIIPSREMRTVSKRGLADGLFAGWRYREIGGRDPDPGFVLNEPARKGARILIAGANFGCGSSREHAVWALAEYGIRAIIAPSFAPIFQANCVANGLVPAILPHDLVHALAAHVERHPAAVVTVHSARWSSQRAAVTSVLRWISGASPSRSTTSRWYCWISAPLAQTWLQSGFGANRNW